MSIAISTHLSRVLKQQKPTRNEVNGMELAERKKKILSAVIESYINTGEPIGSKALINETGLEVSSATVRNDLADKSRLLGSAAHLGRTNSNATGLQILHRQSDENYPRNPRRTGIC